MPVGACSRAATIACAAADDRLELLASLRALRAAGLMIAHGFTVEQMVEMCAPGSCDGDRHAMGAGWSALRHQASSSPRGPCRRHNSGGTESHESLLGQRHRDDAIGAGRGTISIVMPREGSITCAMCAPTHGHEVTRAKRRWRRSGRPGGGGKRRGQPCWRLDSERSSPFVCFQRLSSVSPAITAPYIHNGFLAQCLTCCATRSLRNSPECLTRTLVTR